MGPISRACLAVVPSLPLTACAATIPPASTFIPDQWAVVEVLPPGTKVDVSYVAARPHPLRHSFTGEIESVNASLLVIRTKTGLQRLLAERVLQVSRVTAGKRRGDKIRLGILAGAAIGVALTVVYPGEREGRIYAMRILAGVGALIGGASGASAGAEARQLVYRRR